MDVWGCMDGCMEGMSGVTGTLKASSTSSNNLILSVSRFRGKSVAWYAHIIVISPAAVEYPRNLASLTGRTQHHITVILIEYMRYNYFLVENMRLFTVLPTPVSFYALARGVPLAPKHES